MSNWTGNLKGLYHEGESAPDHLQQLFLPLSISGYEPASRHIKDAGALVCVWASLAASAPLGFLTRGLEPKHPMLPACGSPSGRPPPPLSGEGAALIACTPSPIGPCRERGDKGYTGPGISNRMRRPQENKAVGSGVWRRGEGGQPPPSY